MQMFDFPNEFPDNTVSEAAERIFQEHYLHPLGDNVKYVRLQSEFRVKCPGNMPILFDRNA